LGDRSHKRNGDFFCCCFCFFCNHRRLTTWHVQLHRFEPTFVFARL
jgi:hypothetical protein